MIFYWLVLVFGALTLFITPCVAQSNNVYTFTTIAGSTNVGFADGGGSSAQFNNAQGIAVDTNYNVYLTDSGNSTIRQLVFNPTNWQSFTIAGSALTNGSGDGTNNAALFNNPEGLCVDKAGNLYVTDTGNSTIRKITLFGTNWVTTTIAGGVQTNGSTDGTNTMSRFSGPQGIAVKANGTLFVADTLNDTIRMIKPVGTNWITSTIAGLAGTAGTNDGSNSLARFSFPEGVAVDLSGHVYVADTTNDIIRKLTLVGTNWVVTTIAGTPNFTGSTDGTNNNARFFDPGGIAVDGSGNLYVGDSGNQTIRKIIPVGTNWVTITIGGIPGVAGYQDGTGTNALFSYPKGLCVDLSSNLYVDGNSAYEGFTVSGGVSLLGDDFTVTFTKCYINVLLWPAAATNAGAAWGLAIDPPTSLSCSPVYTRNYDTTTESLQFAVLKGWLVPTNTSIPVQAGIPYLVQTNLYYIALPPIMSVIRGYGLGITGTVGTTYRIQYATDLRGPWQDLMTASPLTSGLNQLQSWPPPWPANNHAPATYYRAVWTGN